MEREITTTDLTLVPAGPEAVAFEQPPQANWACDGKRPIIATPAATERVVLIHCSASSARQWKALAEQLAGFEATPLNLFGHGEPCQDSGQAVAVLTLHS